MKPGAPSLSSQGLIALRTGVAATAVPRPRFWQNLDERADDPARAEAVTREFAPGADLPAEGVSRRGFVHLLGASAGVAGIAACQRPTQKIVPYVRRPPEVTPGNPQHFATASTLEGFATALLVESHTGRPTKVEGNPDQAISGGHTTALEQALTLGLYDQDRLRQITHREAHVDWRTLNAELNRGAMNHAADGGARVRFLVEPSASPLVGDLRARILQKLPSARFVSYSSVAGDGAIDGAEAILARPLEVQHQLVGARVIVALDADFLTDGPQQLPLARQFAVGRTPDGAMNRLYVVEPNLTPTGAAADHRLRVRGSDIVAVARAVLAEMARQPGREVLAPLAALPGAALPAGVEVRFLQAMARDLGSAGEHAVVIAGRRQPAAVHALAYAINAAIGSAHARFREPVRHDARTGVGPLEELVQEMAAGKVDTLVITAHNPAYGAPVDFKFADLQRRVPNVIYLGLHADETAVAAGTVIPRAHMLESWGDGRSIDGTASLVQPLIEPLWSGRTEADVLAAFVGEGDRGTHRLLQEYWQRRATAEGWLVGVAGGFDSLWEAWLAKGVIDNTFAPTVNASVSDWVAAAGRLGRLLVDAQPVAGIEVAFAPDAKVFDGRFANNAWLQELAHPVSKITWDNAIIVSPHTAADRKLKTGDVVRLEVDGRPVTGPLFEQPGHVDGAVTVALGYGRTGSEQTAIGVGFNAGQIRASGAFWFAGGARLTKTARGYRFGITQGHSLSEGREPVLVASVQDLRPEGPFHARADHHRGTLPVIHAQVDYSKQKYAWGMAIDLNTCTGCNACVVACQSENNIPTVGRDNVRIGREMAWIRIDRYYEGNEADPEVVVQPVMCQHCETAPCEYVCPVNATVHSDEGLNEMVYNRCIGTRYCSNNCPYKARRFNFFDYQDDVPAVRNMVANPDVTVRARGVMEKCTYCVQRIERARIDSRIEGRDIADGEIQTACQQVCPSEAIVFGSINDRDARVSQLHADARRYNLLHDIGTRPRTAYLARIRNPNPDLA